MTGMENLSPEPVWVESNGDNVVLNFRCPCGDGYQILLSGNNCYYKLIAFPVTTASQPNPPSTSSANAMQTSCGERPNRKEEPEKVKENLLQESIWIETTEDGIVVSFQCPCGHSFEVFVSGNHCQYKMTSF